MYGWMDGYFFCYSPGEVFVHRNIGNQVPGNDLNVLSVLEFAVGHLGVTDIIVTGHYSCGAVKAATSRQDLGTLENWLRLIRDVYRLHKDYLDLIKDPEQLHRTLVELNVIEQCLNIFKTGVVQRKRAQTRKELMDAGKNKQEVKDGVFPRIHGMVFNPAEGILRVLPVNFQQRVGSLDHIYGLYENVRYKDYIEGKLQDDSQEDQ
jgi:carbonic anhydrase